MSILALLAHQQAVQNNLPPLLQGLEQAKPKSFARTWDIAADGSKQFTSITSAAEAAIAYENSLKGNTRYSGWSSPYRRHRFRVWPGEYKEANWPTPTHFALIGMGSKPEDVRIWDDRGNAGTGGTNEDGTKSGENIINAAGKSLYVENVWLDHTSADPEWHAMRIVGASGDVGRRGFEKHSAYFRRVRFSSAYDGMSGKCAIDATISAYSTIFDRCFFDTPGQGQSLNVHISSGDHFFYGCSIRAGYGFIDDPTLPHNGRFANGQIAGAIPVQISPFAKSMAPSDTPRAWWVESEDSDWDVGRYEQAPDTKPRGAIATVAVGSFPAVSEVHIDQIPDIDQGVPGWIVKTGSEWEQDPQIVDKAFLQADRVVPSVDDLLPVEMVDGITPAEKGFYGGNPFGMEVPDALETGTDGFGDFGPSVYWVKVPVFDGCGLLTQSISCDLAGDGSVSYALAYSNDPSGQRPASPLWESGFIDPGAVAKCVGAWLYPGHEFLWVRVVVEGQLQGSVSGILGLVESGGQFSVAEVPALSISVRK